MKLASVKPGTLICISVPECFLGLISPEFAVLGRIKKRLTCLCAFPVLCKLYL